MARQVKVTLVVDEKGAVKALRSSATESEHTTHKFDELDSHVKKLGKSFGGLKSMIGLGIGSIGLGGLAFGLKDIASKTGEVATETEKFHSVSGFGATASLRYTAALKARGIGAEAGGKAFRFLAKNVELAERQEHTFGIAQEKASKTGKVATGLLGVQAAAFQKLGINLGSFSKLSEEAKFELITKKFEAMKPGMDKTRLALQLFGRGGTALLPVLEKNNLSLTKQLELVKKFYPTIKGGSKSMEELLEKQAESKMAWEGLEFTLGEKLIPVMTKVMAWTSNVIVEIEHGKGAWGGFRKDIEGVVTAGKDVIGFLDKLGKAFKIPVEAGGLGAALMAFAGIHAIKHPLKSAVTSTKVLSAAAKFSWKHPETAPIVLGGALATAYGVDVYKSRKELAGNAQGGLSMLKGGPSAKALAGIAPGSAGEAQWLKEHAGPQGRTQATGRPVGGSSRAADAAMLSRLLEHPNLITAKSTSGLSRADLEYLAGQFSRAHEQVPKPVEAHLYVDSQEVATAIMHNPRSARSMAETVVKHASYMQARGAYSK